MNFNQKCYCSLLECVFPSFITDVLLHVNTSITEIGVLQHLMINGLCSSFHLRILSSSTTVVDLLHYLQYFVILEGSLPQEMLMDFSLLNITFMWCCISLNDFIHDSKTLIDYNRLIISVVELIFSSRMNYFITLCASSSQAIVEPQHPEFMIIE